MHGRMQDSDQEIKKDQAPYRFKNDTLFIKNYFVLHSWSGNADVRVLVCVYDDLEDNDISLRIKEAP